MTDQDDFEKWYDSKELASYEASYDIATYSGRELLGILSSDLAWAGKFKRMYAKREV